MAKVEYILTADEIEEIYRRWIYDASRNPKGVSDASPKANAECFIRYLKQLPTT